MSSGGKVKGIVVSRGAELSRKTFDELQEFAKRYGAAALAWIKIGDEVSSSLLKVLGDEVVKRLAQGLERKEVMRYCLSLENLRQ